jgi:hypothetical protein
MENKMKLLESTTSDNHHSHNEDITVLQLKDVEMEVKMALMQHKIEEMSAQLCFLTTNPQTPTPLLETPTSVSRPASTPASRSVSRAESRHESRSVSRAESRHSETGSQAASDADNMFESGRTNFSSDRQGRDRSHEVSASCGSWDGPPSESPDITQLMSKSSNLLMQYTAEHLAMLARKRDAAGEQY